MALPYKYFRFPFAVAGDLTAIPDTVQPDGSVSYDQGWGPDYQLDPATQPAALNIERQKTNQLMNDMTTALQWYQTGHAPQFIAAADNGGVAYSYDVGARVLNPTDGLLYESFVPANTAVPGPGSNSWSRVRTRLAAPLTLNVAASGGDFTTPQACANALQNNYDFNGQPVTVQMAAGLTWPLATFRGLCVGQTSPIIINGDAVTPANVRFLDAITATLGAWIQPQNLQINGANSGCLQCSEGGVVDIGPKMIFGATNTTGAHIYVNNGGQMNVNNSYSIVGGAQSHYRAYQGIITVNPSIVITLTGTPAFSSFTDIQNFGGLVFGSSPAIATFTGAATGQRFGLGILSTIVTSGAGAAYLPGNTAGSISSGSNAVYN